MAGEVISMQTKEITKGKLIHTAFKVREGSRSFWIQWSIMAIVSLVLGQAMIYHHAAPFLWILLVLTWRRGRTLFAGALLGGAIGTLTGVGLVPSALVVVLTGLVPVPWRAHSQSWDWLQWPIVGLGAGALYLVGQPLTVFTGSLTLLIAGGAVALYWAASREISRYDQGIGDQGTLILAVAAIGALIAGLEGMVVGPFEVGLVLGGLMILASAILAGAAGGAVAGATLGLTLAVRGSDPAGGIGLLVACGFFSGWFATRHWRMGSLGLALGLVLYTIVIRMPGHLTGFWISICLAAVLIQVVPNSIVEVGKSWAQALIDGNERETVSDRLDRISSVMNEMARAFRIEEEPVHSETTLVETVVDNVCKKCSLYRACWEDDFYRSYRAVLDLTARAETEIVSEQHLSGDLARRCIRPDAVAHSANVAMSKEKERATLALRVRESRALAEVQLTGLSELVKRMAKEMMDEKPVSGSRASVTKLDYRVGLDKRPRRGGLVTGDSDLVRELSDHRVVFGLSDGMGVGPRAAWESGTAVSLLEQLLLAGFSQVLAVRAVNTTLLLRSVDDHFATLDLVLVDRMNRGAELVKVAAAPTFLRRHGRVEVIHSHTLPVGIIQEVPIDPIYHTLEPGDVIVMVTDGVLENNDDRGEEKLRLFLQELPALDPQVMAQTILSYMLGDDEDGRDDSAVMVIQIDDVAAQRKIFTKGSGNTMEWQRLTPSPIRKRAK